MGRIRAEFCAETIHRSYPKCFYSQENPQSVLWPRGTVLGQHWEVIDPALSMNFPDWPVSRPRGKARHPAPPRIRSRLRGGWLCYKYGLWSSFWWSTEYWLPFLTAFPTILLPTCPVYCSLSRRVFTYWTNNAPCEVLFLTWPTILSISLLYCVSGLLDLGLFILFMIVSLPVHLPCFVYLDYCCLLPVLNIACLVITDCCIILVLLLVVSCYLR